MRAVREVTSEEEHFRIEPLIPGSTRFSTIRRDPVKPEPEGTIVLMAFRVTGYDPDCDGSLMARLERIDKDGERTGWEPNAIGLYPSADLVVTADELRRLFEPKQEAIP